MQEHMTLQGQVSRHQTDRAGRLCVALAEESPRGQSSDVAGFGSGELYDRRDRRR